MGQPNPFWTGDQNGLGQSSAFLFGLVFDQFMRVVGQNGLKRAKTLKNAKKKLILQIYHYLNKNK